MDSRDDNWGVFVLLRRVGSGTGGNMSGESLNGPNLRFSQWLRLILFFFLRQRINRQPWGTAHLGPPTDRIAYASAQKCN